MQSLQADPTLIRGASTRCGGGSIHMATQYIHAYRMAVDLYNEMPKRRTELSDDIKQLEGALYRLSIGLPPLAR